MEKEISSGAMLGVVLIALAAVIGLGFGVFSIVRGVANESTIVAVPVLKLHINTAVVSFVSLALMFIGGVIQITYKNVKFGIIERVEDTIEQTIFRLKKESKLKVVQKYDLGAYDLLQFRTEMRLVNIVKALRCRPDVVRENIAIVVPRTLRKVLIGAVEDMDGYYKIGDAYLAKGGIVLQPGSNVKLTVDTPVSYTSAVDVYDKYTVVEIA